MTGLLAIRQVSYAARLTSRRIRSCSLTAPRPAAAFPDSARPRTVAGSPLVVALPADRSIGGVGGRSPRRDGRRTICSIQSIRRLTAASWRWRPVANCAAHEPRMISTPTTPLTRCRYDALTAATTTTTSLVARRSWFRLVARCRRQIMILFRGSCGAGEAKTLGPPSGRWAHYAARWGLLTAHVAAADDDEDA